MCTTTVKLTKQQKDKADLLYLLLAALFVAALVSCNLIANKFVAIDLGFKTFQISAGVLPYPITFLITDLLSEIYGQKKTNRVVLVGFVASMFVLFILFLGGSFDALDTSPVTNEVYDTTFKNAVRIIFASMIAYIMAQLVDVRLFHFWKKLTKGKALWLRNNASTIFSQLVDTTLVVLVIFAGVETSNTIFTYIIDGWTFKLLVALVDTPLLYGATWVFREMFGLQFGEELSNY